MMQKVLLINLADKPGLKAFKTCRQALKKGGDGLAAKKDLETLNQASKS